MTTNNNQSIWVSISELKKKLLEIRIKKTSGNKVENGDIKKTKKEIARLLTKINKKN
jgi:ribosomal protein L29